MEDKITCIFKGFIVRKIYEFRGCQDYDGKFDYGKPWIEERMENVKTEIFYKCEIYKPPFNIREKIYINELDLEVYINDAFRTTNNEYMYIVSHTIEIIEDEESKRSKLEAEERLKEELIKYEEYIKETEIKETEIQNRKWYQLLWNKLKEDN